MNRDNYVNPSIPKDELNTRGSRTTCSLVDNFFNRFRMVSRTLRQVDNYFQPFQDGFEKFSDKQTNRQFPETKSALRAACIIFKSPSLKNFIRKIKHLVHIKTFSELLARPFS